MTQPTVDLGYPTEAHGRIPAFQNIEEEAEWAEWWDTHDLTDYLDELEPVRITFAKRLSQPYAVTFDPQDRAELARQAREQGVQPPTLIRRWVQEWLRQQATTATKSH